MGEKRIVVSLLAILACLFLLMEENWSVFSQVQYEVLKLQSFESNGSATNLEFTSTTPNSVTENFEEQETSEDVDNWTGQDGVTSTKSPGSTDGQIGEKSTAAITPNALDPTVSQMRNKTSGAIEEVEGIHSANIQILPSTSLQSTRVNCQHLFKGETRYPDEVETATHINESTSLEPGDIMDKTKDCELFKEIRGYIIHPLTAEEEEFPLAYSILMYTAPGQVERLLRAIYRPQNFYCIHIDIKTENATKEAMKSISDCFANVYVVPNPVEVNWGEFGVLEAEIICMEHLVQYKWKYFINLTGQEFPLATNHKIVQVLKTYNGANEIGNEVITLKPVNTHQPLPEVPFNITIYKGSAHVVLSRNFVDYILNDPVPRNFLKWMRNVSCPEEIFFASLQHNTHLKAPGTFKVHKNEYRDPISRHKIWHLRRLQRKDKCYSKEYKHGLCIFGVRDLPSLFKDDHSFFINKLYDNFQPVTYDCLEELLANRTREEYSGHRKVDLEFFKQLPFVANHY